MRKEIVNQFHFPPARAPGDHFPAGISDPGAPGQSPGRVGALLHKLKQPSKENGKALIARVEPYELALKRML